MCLFIRPHASISLDENFLLEKLLNFFLTDHLIKLWDEKDESISKKILFTIIKYKNAGFIKYSSSSNRMYNLSLLILHPIVYH